MSVNLSTGLFMRNYHMQGNAVQKAPAASLSTPLAADKTGSSFKKVGFKGLARLFVDSSPLKPSEVDIILSIVQKGGVAAESQLQGWVDRIRATSHIPPELKLRINEGLKGAEEVMAKAIIKQIKFKKNN